MTTGVFLIADGRIGLAGFPTGDITLRIPKIGEYRVLRRRFNEITESGRPVLSDDDGPPMPEWWREVIATLAEPSVELPDELDAWPLWACGITDQEGNGIAGTVFRHWLTVPLAHTPVVRTA